MKSINTENLKLDDKTCELTKYIYTDYEIVEEIDNGNTYEKYIPISNSRIPLHGNFGDSENPSFTLREYLRESPKWIFLLDLPSEIRTGILNYVNFFKDFIKSTENYNVDIANMPEGEKTRITILTSEEENREKIIYSFRNYIKNIFEPFNKLQIEFRNTEIGDLGKKRFLINYNNELQTTQIRFQYGLQNLSDVERTKNTFELLLQEKDKQLDKYHNLLLQYVNKESTPENITVNVNQDVAQESTITISNVSEINLGLSDLLYELEKSQKDNNIDLIESLIEEIKSIKSDLKNPKQVEVAKSRQQKKY